MHQIQREQTHALLRDRHIDQAVFARPESVTWLTGFAVPVQTGPNLFAASYKAPYYSKGLAAKVAELVNGGCGFKSEMKLTEPTVDYCVQLTGYRNDARILAAAEECRADLLVTHDKTHLLRNPLISPPDTHCRVKTAQEALDWLLERLASDEKTS